MSKIVLEGVVSCKSEDGTMAKIGEVTETVSDEITGTHGMGFFVRLQSWIDPDRTWLATPRAERRPLEHPVLDAMEGKRVRVTVEIVE